MRKFFTLFLSVFFVMGASAQLSDKSVGVHELWKKAQVDNTTWQLVGSVQRNMAVLGDKVLIPTNTKAIYVASAETGAYEKTVTLTAPAAFHMHGIAVTTDNQVIVGNTGSGATLLTLYTVNLDASSTSQLAAIDVSGASFGRADLIYTYGSLAGTGLFGAVSITGNVLVAPMSAGVIGTPQYFMGVVEAASGANITFLSDKLAIVASQSKAKVLLNLETGARTTLTLPVSVAPNGDYFAIGDRAFYVASGALQGGFSVYSVENGAVGATALYTVPALGAVTGYAGVSVPIHVGEIGDNYAVIYQYSPHNALASFELVIPIVADPVFNPTGGVISEPASVAISTTTVGATIRYTLDGSDPTEASTEYTAPIELVGEVTVKAKAWLAGAASSKVVSATYTVDPTSVNEDAASATKVYPSNGAIVVETASIGATIEVYTLQGAKIAVASASGSDELSLNNGIYIVKVGNDVFKVVL